MLILSGFILSSLFLATAGFVTSCAGHQAERAVVAFTLGAWAGSAADSCCGAAAVVAGSVAVWLWGGTLDVPLSGEEEPARWGRRGRGAALSSVSHDGGRGVGRWQHLRRADRGTCCARWWACSPAVDPAAGLLGGTFVACDVLARTLPSRAEIRWE
jgi:hypothetical protein